MKALGIVLVVVGLVALIYGGISWTRKDTVVDAGPIEITTTSAKASRFRRSPGSSRWSPAWRSSRPAAAALNVGASPAGPSLATSGRAQ